MISADEEKERRWFYVAVAATFALCLAPAVSWTLAVLARSTVWKRRIIAVAIVDTLASLTFAVGSWPLIERAHHGTNPPAPVAAAGPRIGAELSAQDSPVIIARPLPLSPAEQAGLLPGDQVLAVDGQPVADKTSFVAAISSTPGGSRRTLTIRRDGSEQELAVTPSRTWKPPVHGPFVRGTAEPVGFGVDPRAVTAWGGFFIAIAALAWFARRRNVTARPAFAAAGALVASFAASSTAHRALEAALGPTLGGEWLATLAGEGVLAGIAAAGLVALAPPTAAMPAAKAWLLGVLFVVTGAFRFGMLLLPFHVKFELPVHGLSPDSASSGISVALLVALVAVAGPVAEELLFRGVLLPWLAGWLRPWSGIAVSSALFGMLHYTYGVLAVWPAFLGVVLGWMRLRTGKLAPCVALHMTVNALAVVRYLAH